MSVSRKVSARIARRFGAIALVAPLVLAACADGGDEFTAALKDAEIAAGRDSSHALGVFHFKSGNYGLAVQQFQTASSRRPRSIESWNGLAASYDKLGRFDLAERFYRRALVVDPQSAQTLNNLGYSYWLQGRYDLALAYLKDADGLDGGNRVIEANRKLAGSALRAELASPEIAEIDAETQSPVPMIATAASVDEVQGPHIATVRSGVHKLVTRPEIAPEVPSELPLSLTLSREPLPLRNPRVAPAVSAVPQIATARVARAPQSVTEPVSKVVAAAAESFQDVTLAGQNSLSLSVEAPNLAAARLGWLDVDYVGESDPSSLGIRLPEPSRLQRPARAEHRLPARQQDGARVELARANTQAEPDAVSQASPPQIAIAPSSLPVIELSNGVGREGMAARLKGFLNRRGLPVARLTNVDAYDRQRTTIYYRPGWEPYAMGLAGLLPAEVVLQPSDGLLGDKATVDIRIELGGDMLNFDRDLLAERVAPDDISG